ncbi:MAG: uracil-DNA glycosylase [Parachlamydiales bacterium]|jgi:uracil-DNA glycosylase
MFNLEPSWKDELKQELIKPYISKLSDFIERENQQPTPIYPPRDLVFNAFWHTPYDEVSVVIVGQDPYHGQGQAHGLSFSVPQGVPQPPSLRNIFKEIKSDLDIAPPDHGCLIPWADQGVFLLNALLTVRAKQPLSHQNQGWEQFTDAVILALAKREKPIVFMLWGSHAQKKLQGILQDAQYSRHLVLKAPHPSPFSAYTGFFGCGHFSKANQFIIDTQQKSIDWKI